MLDDTTGRTIMANEDIQNQNESFGPGIMCSERTNQLSDALIKAQHNIKYAVKDAVNSHKGSKYADLSSCWGACREALRDAGLGVFQTPMKSANLNELTVRTTIRHLGSNQWKASDFTMPIASYPGCNAVQSVGLVLTYMRRYVLAAELGICPDDSDGEGPKTANTNESTNGHANPETPKKEKASVPSLDQQFDKAMNGITTSKAIQNLDAWLSWTKQFSFTDAQKDKLNQAHKTRSAILNPANNI
jgi:hypothetical protein